nr:hypothetical protein [Tanacetum cinerariifolium]
NDNWGIEKSARIGPNELSHVIPKITSAPCTGITNKGTVNWVLLISNGVAWKHDLHSRNWPLPTMTGNGVMAPVTRTALGDWRPKTAESERDRNRGCWGRIDQPVTRTALGDWRPKTAESERDRNRGCWGRIDQVWCAWRICHRWLVGRRCQQLAKTGVGCICGLGETFRDNENKDPQLVAFEVLQAIVG